MLVEACNGQAVQVDVQRLPENARIVSIALELSLIVSKFPVTMFVDVLGQAYHEAGGNITLLAIRITNLGDEFGKIFLFNGLSKQSSQLNGDLGLVERILPLIHDPRFDDIFNPLGKQYLSTLCAGIHALRCRFNEYTVAYLGHIVGSCCFERLLTSPFVYTVAIFHSIQRYFNLFKDISSHFKLCM